MQTYQDFLGVGTTDKARLDFCKQAIEQHRTSDLFKTAEVADEYDRHQNRTITQYRKILYDVTGRAIPDNISANYKMASRFFNRFITQQNQFLLGNGVTWKDEATAEKMGADFDMRLQEIGRDALVGGVAFGFWNFDHLEVFSVLEFVPLYDEENGALSAGIRFWQIDSSKPLRATLYEVDGYTDYIWTKDASEGRVLNAKRRYVNIIRSSDANGLEILDGVNLPGFPIVPLWGNPAHQSEIVGIREQIDCYDLIKSGFADTVDEASYVYWTLQNAGGMDDVDLAEFVERLRTVHAATVSNNVQAESHMQEAPYASREALLDRLEKDLYKDFMALNTEDIASGAVTATQIRAAYEPLNNKTDQYEYCILGFLNGIMALAGVDDEPTFTRSMLVNTAEEIQNLIAAGSYLDAEYVTRKILTLLGDGDKADEMLDKQVADEAERTPLMEDEPQEETEE